MTVAVAVAAAGGGRPGRCATWPRAAPSTPPASDCEGRAPGRHRPARVVFWVFVITGALTGCAALLNSVRFSQIPANAGIGLEMKVIAAVVVGGTAITGGRGTVAGTLLGVVLLGDDRPGADVPGRQRVLGKGDSGRDHPGGGGHRCRARGRDRGDMQASLPLTAHRTVARALVPQRRMGAAGRAGARDRGLLRHRREFLHRRQFLRGHPPERRARTAGARADAGHHHRRHRSFGRLDDGAVRGRSSARPGATGIGPSRPRRCWRLLLGCGRRRAERAADHAAQHSAADRDARLVLAVPRHRRRHHAGAVNYSDFPPGSCSSARATCSASSRRSFRSSSWRWSATPFCCTARRSAARCTPSASPRPARATPASPSPGASGWSTFCPGWCRASRPSSTWRTSARRSRTPAPATSWPRSPRWCWAARRSSAAAAPSGARSSACSRSRCCRTACTWPRCLPN